MLEINRNPSDRDLRWFGLSCSLFFGLAGWIINWRFESLRTAQLLWVFGVVLLPVYYLIPRIRKPFLVGWMVCLYPIGWSLSHLVLMITGHPR